MDIFKLVGSVFIDTDKANESLSKTDEKAEGLGKKLQGGIKTAGKWAAGLTAAAGAVGGAMIASAKETAGNADVVDKASQRMGISTDTYQELAHAAGLCGVEMSTMEKAAKKLEGTDLSMDDALASIYELGTAEERSAMAAELFGETVAYQMSPMLNASAEDMASMRDEAHELGLVMSEDAVKAGANMNDTFSKVEGAMDSVKNQIGTALMPMVEKLLGWVLDNMPAIQEAIGEGIAFIENLINELIPIIEKLSPIVSAIFEGIGFLWETLLKPVLDGILTFLDGVFTGDWEKIWQGLGDIVAGIFNGLVEIVKIPINAIIGLLNKAIGGFNKIQIPEWVPGVGGKGLNIPEIPMLAKGGNVTIGGSAIVGEAGPELLNLPTGASVTPLGGSNGIMDMSQMKEAIEQAFVNALSRVGLELTLSANSSSIFDDIIEQNLIYKNRHGGASAI